MGGTNPPGRKGSFNYLNLGFIPDPNRGFTECPCSVTPDATWPAWRSPHVRAGGLRAFSEEDESRPREGASLVTPFPPGLSGPLCGPGEGATLPGSEHTARGPRGPAGARAAGSTEGGAGTLLTCGLAFIRGRIQEDGQEHLGQSHGPLPGGLQP